MRCVTADAWVTKQEVTKVLLAPIKVVMVVLRVGGTGSVVTVL